ncbi:hypothetical protein INF37_08070 [Pseudoflavonifractor sp. DSM 107456]|uniref:Uncharacterized protein n=1 Tax=Pseudoflavonifractor gallinarum TaxID=2779352 RepID=A0ABR9RB87_9FIRM|nr:hypothetical protein [Pseudoflavonifractor gallinarum]MBE5055952.1 hypothetical protein [Pseudoflavonifractor gallinarum]
MGKSNKELAVELVAAYYSTQAASTNERFSEDRIEELILMAKRALDKIPD